MPLGDLAREVAVDGGEARLDPRPLAVVQQDIEARHRADLGDAAAHLTRTDDPDPLDFDAHVVNTPPTRGRTAAPEILLKHPADAGAIEVRRGRVASSL
ncbi:hypothetical protein AEGHOMDF_4074 [Methylobacterium soli]|nr:hypothetical protein AEGHOMDF_4074 [Methylobacterium soli]